MRVGAAMDVRFDWTFDRFCEYVVDCGLEHVELKMEYVHGHPDAPDPETVAERSDAYDVTVTYHAPFRDWNPGSFNEDSRVAAVEQVNSTLEAAATAGAGAVVVHGGSVPYRYPEYVRERARDAARRSLAECARYAAEVDVPLCLENQPQSDSNERHTTSPDDLAAMLESVDVDDALGVTLDVGHARVNGFDWRTFADRFADRIHVVHLHDNDGVEDRHEPLADFEPICEYVDAPYNVFEMKRVPDVERCLEESTTLS
ncbi:sugar phosphate isomerase/epimerase family protein [Natrarchaeobius sp. A-rgal3]|uniref:sugar phosphate isomerase/epimerase family protein n=1 Tax=Natrarchaeobius versutus TaxID=1679078 RepID=UPI00350FD11A